MRNIQITLAFQGTRYDGWQSQRTGKTVQEIVEKHLARILKEPTHVQSSSRTDSGVHARCLPAHFRTKSPIPCAKIVSALNFYLPDDITVLSAREMKGDFHARFHAKSKIYEYIIWNHRIRPPYDRAPFVLWYPGKLNIKNMRKAARFFIGRHDFSAFRDSGADERNPVKSIRSVTFSQNGPAIAIRFTGDGFLRHMIRILVGTLMSVGKGKITPNEVPSIIRSKDRKLAGPTSKSHGLTLIKVRY